MGRCSFDHLPCWLSLSDYCTCFLNVIVTFCPPMCLSAVCTTVKVHGNIKRSNTRLSRDWISHILMQHLHATLKKCVLKRDMWAETQWIIRCYKSECPSIFDNVCIWFAFVYVVFMLYIASIQYNATQNTSAFQISSWTAILFVPGSFKTESVFGTAVTLQHGQSTEKCTSSVSKHQLLISISSVLLLQP